MNLVDIPGPLTGVPQKTISLLVLGVHNVVSNRATAFVQRRLARTTRRWSAQSTEPAGLVIT
jgi:hypothetical protein